MKFSLCGDLRLSVQVLSESLLSGGIPDSTELGGEEIASLEPQTFPRHHMVEMEMVMASSSRVKINSRDTRPFDVDPR